MKKKQAPGRKGGEWVLGASPPLGEAWLSKGGPKRGAPRLAEQPPRPPAHCLTHASLPQYCTEGGAAPGGPALPGRLGGACYRGCHGCAEKMGGQRGRRRKCKGGAGQHVLTGWPGRRAPLLPSAAWERPQQGGAFPSQPVGWRTLACTSKQPGALFRSLHSGSSESK